MTSTFISSVPQPGDKLRVSQGQLLNNNQALSNIFGIDHLPFIDVSTNQGKHKKSTYVSQVSDPTTIAGEAAVYSKDYSISLAGTPTNVPTVVVKNQTEGTIWPFHLVKDIPIVNPGYIQLGPVIFCWGTFVMPVGVNASYTFDGSDPSHTIAYNFTLPTINGWAQFQNGTGGTASISCSAFTRFGMTISTVTPGSGSTKLMSYFIIGPANP